MSPKNKLQEYLQKRKESIPTYQTKRCGGSSHEPQFKSILTFQTHRFESELFSRKKEAEQDVAQKALDFLEKKNSYLLPTPKYTPPKNPSRIILFDLENCPKVFGVKFPRDARLIGFTSYSSSIYAQKEKYENIMELRVIKSSIKDAADVALTIDITRLIFEERVNVPITIVTRDHFASAIVRYIDQNITHVTHVSDV